MTTEEISTTGKKKLPFLQRLLKRRKNGSGALEDSASDAFILFDETLKVVGMNPLVLRLFNMMFGGDVVEENILGAMPGAKPDVKNKLEREEYLKIIRKGERFFTDSIVVHSGFVDVSFQVEAFKVRNGLGVVFSNIVMLKKAEQSPRESEGVLTAYLERGTDFIYIHDLKGTFLGASRAGERLTGYSWKEVEGKSLLEVPLLAPEYLAKAAKLLEQNAAGKPTGPDEFELIRKDGSRVFVEISTCPVGNGDKIEVIGIARDITERKRTEKKLAESEVKYRTIFESTLEGIVLSQGSRIVAANKALLNMLGYETVEELNRIPVFDHIVPAYRNIIGERIEKREKGESASPMYACEFLHRNGEARYFEVSTAEVIIDGEKYVQSNFRDMTERKRVEEALQKSEERFRNVLENSVDVIFRVNLKTGIFDYISPSLKELSGFSPEEIVGLSYEEVILSWVHPDDRAMVEEDYRKLRDHTVEKGAIPVLEGRIKHEKLGYRWISITRTIEFDDKNAPILMNGNVRDMTERKMAEDMLRESEGNFRALSENSLDAITVLADGGFHVYANSQIAETTGYSLAELYKMTFRELVHPDEVEKLTERYERRLRGEPVPSRYETVIVRKDGRSVPVEVSATRTMWRGEPAALVMYRDITEHRKSEEALRQSEERFRSVLDNSLDMVYRMNLETGRYDYVSPSTEKILGYNPEEFLAFTIEEARSLAHPDDLSRLDDNVIELVMNQSGENANSTIEYRIKHKELGYRWVTDSRSVICDDANRPVAVVGNLRDITERKQAEQELWKTRERLQLIFDSVDDGIAVTDLEGNITDVNPKALEMYRTVTKEELIGRSAFELIAPEEHGNTIAELQRVLERGTTGLIEHNVVRSDGSGYTAEMNASMMKDISGKPTGFVAVLRDVTEHRKAADALRESEARFRELTDSISDVFFAMDKELRYVYWNKASELLTGIKEKDAIGKSIFEVFPDTQATKKAADVYRNVIETQQPNTFVNEFQLGEKNFFFEISAYPSSTGVSVFTKDISERKGIEDALRDSEAQFRTIFESSALGIGLVDARGRPMRINPALEHMLGYSLEELRSMPWKDYMHEDSATADMKLFMDMIAGKRDSYQIEKQYFKKDRREVCGLLTLSAVRDTSGKFLFAVAMVEDITEGKRMVEVLRDSEERYRALVETAGLAGEGIMIVQRMDDGKATIAFANEQLARILGYQKEEMVGMLARNLFLPGDRIWLREKHKRRRKGEELPSHYGVMALRRDGSMVSIEVSMGALKYQGNDATVVYVRDITERKKSEEALRQSEERYRLHFENISDVIYSIDPSFKVLSVSPSVERVLGYRTGDLIGKTIQELNLLTQESLARALSDAKKVLRGRKIVSSEYEFIAGDGTRKFGEVSAAPLSSQNGEVSAIICVARDVTERKHALESLRKSEERLRSLIENAQDVIVIINSEGVISYESPSIERVLGYKPEELIGMDGLGFPHPEDMQEVINVFTKVVQNPGAAVPMMLRVRHKDGSWRIVEAIGRNLLDDPAVAGIVINFRDVTEREQAHEELVRHTKRVEALHSVAQTACQTLEMEELLDTALWRVMEVMNADAGCIYLLDMAEKELVLKAYGGMSEDSIEQVSAIKLSEKNAPQILKWEDGTTPLREIFDAAAITAIAKVRAKEELESFAVSPFTVRGQLHGLIAVGSRTRREFTPADRELLGAVGNQIGVGTQNSMLFEEVRALIRETIDAQERERERVCLEVHDGVAQTLVSAFQYLQSLEAALPDNTKGSLLLAKATAQVKLAIQESRYVINSLQPATLSHLGLVATLRQEMKRLGQETGLKVDFKADDIRLPKDVETGLYRIIHEAVSNARKHSNTKHLRVRISSDDGFVNVEVKDWGKGFDKAYLNTSRRRGTGLFSISKRAELLKGTCEIQSVPGQGTTVRVEIPLIASK